MYKILVVEDEDIIRKGLFTIISKLGLPFELILEAGSGNIGLEIAEREKPHIILTDIKMPKMDGLEFIQRAKAVGCDAVFIIISGFSDFAFAQKAISLGVSQYLLKPVVKKDLFDILSGIISSFEKKARIKQNDAELNTSLLKRINKLQEQVMEQVLFGGYAPEKIQKILADSGIVFEKKSFLIISSYFNLNKKGNASPQDSNHGLSNEIRKFVDIYFSCMTKYGYCVNLINIDDKNDKKIIELHSNIEKYLLTVRSDEGINGFVSISKIGETVASLPEIVAVAEELLDYKNFYYTNKMFSYSELKKGKDLEKVPDLYYLAIYNAINNGNTTDINKNVDNLIKYIINTSEVCPKLFIHAISELFQYLQKSIHMEGANKQLSFINQIDPYQIYRYSESLSELTMNIKEVLLTLRNNLKDPGNHSGNNAIEYILKYMEENYNKNLTLEFVSSLVFLNPNYFSSLFKSKTGLSYSNYLQKIRVEKAKKLLLDPRYKIYEIAEKTGFNDDKYFIKLFKKLTGVSPNQYRNHVGGNTPEL